MDKVSIALWLAVFVVVVYQAFVSTRVAKSFYYSRGQKLFQFVLIWVVPLLAAALCHVVLVSTGRQPNGKDVHFDPCDREYPPGVN